MKLCNFPNGILQNKKLSHHYKSLNNYLTFAVPPAWIQKPEKEIDVIAGNALQIPCLASGSPKPNIAWKREVG